MQYVYLVTCDEPTCVAFENSVRMVEPSNPTICGGCRKKITPLKTDEEWVEPEWVEPA